ncbi:MAG: YggS family pyridoxal phosphate-dependent enzyme [Mariprofundales bacterium]
MNNNPCLKSVYDNITHAAARANRSMSDISLIAVSKTRTMQDILDIYAEGVRFFAENRPQELASKARELAHLTDLQWHYIGNLQSRDCKIIAQYANCFHSIDRLKIARRLSSQLELYDRNITAFVQVNITGEKSKSGFVCDDWQNNKDQLQTLVEVIQEIALLPRLNLLGLMTMAPFNSTEEELHIIFQSMSDLSVYLNNNVSDINMPYLSMGMSGDYQIAIEHGATHVRIGRAIFGER